GSAMGPSVCSSPLSLNQWYLGTAVWDSSAKTLSVYVNAQLANSQKVTNMSPDSRAGAPLTIGSDAPAFSSGYFTGVIDDVRVYSRALPASEIQQLSASDTTPPSVPTGLSATAASSSQVNLSWTASTDNVAVTG